MSRACASAARRGVGATSRRLVAGRAASASSRAGERAAASGAGRCRRPPPAGAGADPRHQLRGGEAAAAVGEEVGLRVGHRHAEDLRPALGQPGLGRRSAGPPRRGRRCSPPAAATAARPGRPCPTCASAGRRPPRAAARARRAAARAARAPRRRCRSSPLGARRTRPAPGCRARVRRTAAAAPRDAGQRQQRGVDLAELDAPAAELDLLVGAAEEQQPASSARTRSPLR